MGCGYAVCALLLVIGVGLLLAVPARWNEKRAVATWALSGAGLAFCFASVALIAPMRRVVARERARRAREEAQPDKPWTWEPAWTTGTGIEQSGRRHGRILLVVGLAAFGLSFPGLIALPGEVQKGNHAIWLVLLFPLVGGGILLSAALAVWRRRKYGRARFVPAALPLPLGGEIAGMVRVNRRVFAEGPGRAELVCWKTTLTRSGNKRSQREEVVARAERAIEAGAWRTMADESQVSVRLHVRGGAETTMAPLALDQPTFEWRLRVRAPTPGADFVAEFVLPVFRVAGADSSAPATGAAIETPEIRARERSEVWRAAGVREVPQMKARGGTALTLPANVGRRHVGWPLLMAMILGGIAIGLWFTPVPGFFALALALFAALPWLAIVALLRRGGERVWVEEAALCSKTAAGEIRRLPLTDLEGIEQRVGVAVGEKQFFRVQARRRSDGTRKLPGRFEIAEMVPGGEAAAQIAAWLRERVPATKE